MNNFSFLNKYLKYKSLSYVIRKWSRIHTIIAFFALFFFAIVKSMFSYTVSDYVFYKWLADSQQIWKVTVPVNRWTIYSWWKRQTIIWTSLNLYDIAVDPQMAWNKQKLADFLIDIVYNETCLNNTSNQCFRNLTRYLRVLDIPNFNNSESFVKDLIKDRIITRLMQTRVTSVMIDRELDDSQVEAIKNLNLSWLYPSNNYLYVNPEEFNSNETNIKSLSIIMWMNEERLKHLTRQRDLRYIPIYNRLSISSTDYIRNYITEENQAIRRGILSRDDSLWNFIILTANPSRYYPEWSLASQVIWFVDSSWKWHYWLEWYYDDILTWNNWEVYSTKDIQWRVINPIDFDTDNLSWEWVQIITTIDRNIQRKVEEALEKWVKLYRANRWMATVMDPYTWEVLAMATYPSYDINNFWDVYELERVRYSEYPNPSTDLLWYPIFVEDTENWQKMIYDSREIYLREASREELWDMALVKYKYKNWYWAWVYVNWTITNLFEPWSIIKPITVAVWLDTWEITRNSMYQDDGSVQIDWFRISNVSHQCLWYNTFWHALNWSCNVWMIRIVQRVWRVLFHQYLEDFGIWVPTWIELAWEVNSRMDPWERWSTAWLFTRSYWLWMSVNQLQVAAAYNVLANWWIYIKPRVVDRIIYPDWREEVFQTEQVRRVIKESTSILMRDLMYDWTHSWQWVWELGSVDWYRFALKSWTAQIPFRGWYETWVASTIWSFAWFWPIEDPRFTMVVTLERPRSSVYGWSTSARIFQEIATYLVDYFEIPKRDYQFNNFYRNN